MDDEIKNQVQNLLSVDLVSASESVKIIALTSKILSNSILIDEIKRNMMMLFNSPDFDSINEISQIIILIVNCIKKCTFYKELNLKRLKYIFWALIYHFLKLNNEIMRKIEIGKLRLSYNNAISLLEIDPSNVKISKRSVIDCCLGCINLYDKIDL